MENTKIIFLVLMLTGSLFGGVDVNKVNNLISTLDLNKVMVTDIKLCKSWEMLKKDKGCHGAAYLKKGRTFVMFIPERLTHAGISFNRTPRKHLISEKHFTKGKGK